jgi:hypothetical protein
MGTMRGTLTLNAAPSAGAVAISVTGGAGQAGKTLQAGDYLQIGSGLGTSQVVMVMADATANGSGVIALTTEPPLRTAFASGTAVQWDRPAAYFKQQGTAVAWSYEPGREIVTTGMAVDLLEVWQ